MNEKQVITPDQLLKMAIAYLLTCPMEDVELIVQGLRQLKALPPEPAEPKKESTDEK